MKAQRIFRASSKTTEERASERALREKIQQEKPSLDDLVQSGECDPASIMPMGIYFDVQNLLQVLKHERERQGLSVANVAERSGLDEAVVSSLESGKDDNPAVATMMRYAAALGIRLMWSCETCEDEVPRRQQA
jgi:ribosome-binding protein aMBF1 (putative translation factor)